MKRSPPDRVEHDVDAAAGDLLGLVLPRSVRAHDVVGAGFRATCSFSSLETTAIVRAPSPFATWSEAVPTPPAAPWTSTVSPGGEPAPQLQREVRRVVVEDERRALGEVELVGELEGHVLGRHDDLGEPSEHAEGGHPVARPPTAAPSGAERTVPPTSLPGTNGRSGLNWYSPRVCSTSGNETPAAFTSTSDAAARRQRVRRLGLGQVHHPQRPFGSGELSDLDRAHRRASYFSQPPAAALGKGAV